MIYTCIGSRIEFILLFMWTDKHEVSIDFVPILVSLIYNSFIHLNLFPDQFPTYIIGFAV